MTTRAPIAAAATAPRATRVAIGLLTLVTLGWPPQARADSRDRQLWTQAALRLKLPHRLRVSWGHALRFDRDSSHLGQSFQHLAARYGSGRAVRLQLGYRYYHIRDGTTGHRVFGDLSLHHDLGKYDLELEYRARAQTTTRGPGDSRDQLTYLRNRVELSYQGADRWTARFGGELYYRVRDGQPNEFRRYRLSAGARWKVTRTISADAELLLQQERAVTTPESSWILGLAVLYVLDAR